MKKDEQANVLLSLKNLYRLFTVKDYPVYSTGILGEKSKKGLTLVRFWDEYLLYEWKSTRHGKDFLKGGSQTAIIRNSVTARKASPVPGISAGSAGMPECGDIWQSDTDF